VLGEVIADRYLLEELLGAGGMSSVYRAHDRVLDRDVALKVLHASYREDEEAVARFRREAQAVAQLSHPNVVTVIDRGEEDQHQFIVFEYVPGVTLKHHLAQQGPLPVDEALTIAIDVGDALAYAHGHGIVHRDVKPQNVILNGDGAAKVTDFGIARPVDVEQEVTASGTVIGTGDYIAPEQASGSPAVPASDVYALGVVIYQLLTGRLPYEGSSLAELAIRRENERPLPPTSYNDAVPETLSAAVLRALENDPAERFGTARSLADGLRAGLAGQDPATVDSEAPTAFVGAGPTDATRTLPRTDEGPATPVSPGPPPRRPPQRAPRPVAQPPSARRGASAGSVVRWILIGVLIFLVIAIVVGLVALSNDSGGSGDIQVDEVVEQEVDGQIQKLEDFIDQNTAPE
jgi:serine/threonine-protein kinase